MRGMQVVNSPTMTLVHEQNIGRKVAETGAEDASCRTQWEYVFLISDHFRGFMTFKLGEKYVPRKLMNMRQDRHKNCIKILMNQIAKSH